MRYQCYQILFQDNNPSLLLRKPEGASILLRLIFEFLQQVRDLFPDAGIVYQTDVTPAIANKVVAIDIPMNFNVIAEYPIAVTKNATHANEAQAFVRYLLSSDGQAVLTKYHFSTAGK